MRRNEAAARLILEDQIDETPMEARVARIESDVGHIKVTLAAQAESIKGVRGEIKDLRGEMKAANDAIAGIRKDGADLKGEVSALRGEVNTLRAEVKGDINTLRGEVNTLRAEVKGDFNTLREETKGQIHRMEIRLVRWLVGTALASCTFLATIAKFLLSGLITP